MKKRIGFVIIVFAVSILLSFTAFADKKPPIIEPVNIEYPIKTSK